MLVSCSLLSVIYARKKPDNLSTTCLFATTLLQASYRVVTILSLPQVATRLLPSQQITEP